MEDTTATTNEVPNHPVMSRSHNQSQDDRIEIPQAKKEDRATEPVAKKKKPMVVTQKGTFRETEWGELFEQLVDYEEIYGDCNVPQKYSVSPQLGCWVMSQRRNKRGPKREATLGVEREAKLESIGFDWGKENWVPQHVRWGQRFQELDAYKQAHGDCNVPQRCKVNPQLSGWVKKQRELNRKATLGDERKAQLNSIGFHWGNKASPMKRKTWRPLIPRIRKGNA